ncbi:MAG: phosphate acetyltransferase, partial [Bacteroidales bacterium]|nr:phosphate acetyltransferase [Bacteroidales bacterium]
MNFIEGLREKSKKNIQKIVLAEGTEERTLRAADDVLKNHIADIILIGNREEIELLANSYDLDNINKAEIIDPENNDRFDYYVDLLMQIRGKKIPNRAAAEELVKKPLYLATLLVKDGYAQGEVAGAEH